MKEEIFTVGDRVVSKVWGEQIITGFEIVGNTMVANFRTCNTPINEIEKVKEPIPLFTTEDGKEIKEVIGFVWFVNSVYNMSKISVFDTISILKEYEGKEITFKLFSTEEAAKEYILMNKPVLSLQDLLDNWSGEGCGVNEYTTTPMFQCFKEVAKNKILC